MAGLHALRNDQGLARYVIEGTSTGRQLGTGSYGSVEEVCLVHAAYFACWGCDLRRTCHIYSYSVSDDFTYANQL